MSQGETLFPSSRCGVQFRRRRVVSPVRERSRSPSHPVPGGLRSLDLTSTVTIASGTQEKDHSGFDSHLWRIELPRDKNPRRTNNTDVRSAVRGSTSSTGATPEGGTSGRPSAKKIASPRPFNPLELRTLAESMVTALLQHAVEPLGSL